MIWRWQRPPRNPNSEIIEAPIIIAEGFELGGKLTLNRPAIVNGRLRGYIQSTAHVSLGPTAVIHGDISARSVTVAGTVIGNVTAEESIHLETGARVTGDLTAPAISISPVPTSGRRWLRWGARTLPSPRTPAVEPALRPSQITLPPGRRSGHSGLQRLLLAAGRGRGTAGTWEFDAATDRSHAPDLMLGSSS